MVRTAGLDQVVARRLLAGALQGWSPLLLTIGFTLAVVAHCLVLGFISFHVFERWFLSLKRYFPSGG